MTANCGQVAALNFIAAGFLCYVVFGFWLELVFGWLASPTSFRKLMRDFYNKESH